MKFLRNVVLGITACCLSFGIADSQKNKPKGANIPPEPWTSVHTRDAFIDRIGEDGFYCRLPAPALVVADTPLFGEYEKVTDTIVTPDWSQLTPDERAIFIELSADKSDKSAQDVFEMEAHDWIMIVETVRWWENCKQLSLKLTPYQAEVQAVRVALAYWKETSEDDVLAKLNDIWAKLENEPSLVPSGQDFPTYFNQHYQKNSSGKDYLWMQAQVVKAVKAEQPELGVVQGMKKLE